MSFISKRYQTSLLENTSHINDTGHIERIDAFELVNLMTETHRKEFCQRISQYVKEYGFPSDVAHISFSWVTGTGHEYKDVKTRPMFMSIHPAVIRSEKYVPCGTTHEKLRVFKNLREFDEHVTENDTETWYLAMCNIARLEFDIGHSQSKPLIEATDALLPPLDVANHAVCMRVTDSVISLEEIRAVVEMYGAVDSM
ncbi:MAG: hypothetical protein CMF22_12010 [Idiomarinaceae bacterium]|nr:hypothetical protein [Idiomarinaceae bacterium]|tara:strand:+ start:12730 stop:13323 length:594 start_codon:yes stop_codon:yes gene_type:complete